MLHIVGVNEDENVISRLVTCELTNRRSLKLVGLLGLGICLLRNNAPPQILPFEGWMDWHDQFTSMRHGRYHTYAILSIPICIAK
jgi:hypothetical protein